ncbi:NADPH-dependent oxidoreductase [Acidisoma cellulosilyticum]|nr:NADPH-dependent oxidoreductase [Acidisoma cellulosilyticum]
MRARYGAPPPSPTGSWNSTLDLLLRHRSVRSYLNDPLPTGSLQSLIAAAQSAATSSNLQTWSVVAVMDNELKSRLAAVAAGQKHIMECPLFLVWLADLSRNEQLADQRGISLEALPYLETFLVASIDAALAAQNAVIAAESLGFSTVYIGALRNNPTEVADILNLPSRSFAVFGLCVGYANPDALPDVKPRLPQKAVLSHNQYDNAVETEIFEGYDQTMAAFSARNETMRTTWKDRVFSRMSKVSQLAGRDRLRDALAQLGFELR